MFNVTVAAEFSVHAKTKYTELYLIDKLFLGLMYAKKITRLCQVVKRCTQKKIGFFLLPHGVQDTVRLAACSDQHGGNTQNHA